MLAHRVSALSNEAPSLFDEEHSPPKLAEPSDAGAPEECLVVPLTLPKVVEPSDAATPEQDTVVPVAPSKVAELSDACTPKEDPAVPHIVAWKVTRSTPIKETEPLVVGDWLSDKDIATWLIDKLYHNEIGEPRAWTRAVIYIVPHLDKMTKYKDSQATRSGLAWRRRHIFIVNSDDKEELHWFVCAMDPRVCAMERRVLVWASKVCIWEPLSGTSLI